MILIKNSDDLVEATVLGDFTLADYQEFEQQALYQIRFHGQAHLLIDLRDMVDYTLDVAWEEIKFSREHRHDFGRIAVLTNDQWIVWSGWLSGLFVDAEIRFFDNDGTAREWLAEGEPAGEDMGEP
jgi:SpoIIAA-like